MKHDISKKKKKIVILGGGFGGVYTAIYLEKMLKKSTAIRIRIVICFLACSPYLQSYE
jgi:NADH dehydrogenase FAD-containing subunit